MGGVTSLFVAEKKGTITTDDINKEVQPFVKDLTENDKKLFNFAKLEISREASKLNIKNATVCIEFPDYGICLIGKSDEQYIRIAMDDDKKCTIAWERQWLSRKICKALIDTDFSSFAKVFNILSPLALLFGMKQLQ